MNQIILLGKVLEVKQVSKKQLVCTIQTESSTDDMVNVSFEIDVNDNPIDILINNIKHAELLAVKLQLLAKQTNGVIYTADKLSVLQTNENKQKGGLN